MYEITMRNADGTQVYSGLGWSHDWDEAHIFQTEEEANFEIDVIKRENKSFENGDYGVWQLKVREHSPRLKVVTSWQTEDEDDGYGGYFTRYTVARIPGQLTDEQIAKLVRDDYPAVRCEHEYDCCGHYYASTATFIRGQLGWEPDKHTVLIEQGFGQNV